MLVRTKSLFYDRMDSNVFAEWLKNVIDDVSFTRLLLKRNAFSFVDVTTGTVSFDGPIMLKIALSKLDPNVIVGIELLW